MSGREYESKIKQTRTSSYKTDEKGVYFDFLGFRFSAGLYTDEFSSKSKQKGTSTITNESWDAGVFEEGDTTVTKVKSKESHKRKTKGTYSPLGGTENVVKDKRKTNTEITNDHDEYGTVLNYGFLDRNLKAKVKKTQSLGKAPTGYASQNHTFKSHHIDLGVINSGNFDGYPLGFDISGDPTQQPTERDTAGGSAGVFAFAVDRGSNDGVINTLEYEPDSSNSGLIQFVNENKEPPLRAGFFRRRVTQPEIDRIAEIPEQVVAIGEQVAGVIVEPYDWFLSGKEILSEPTNPISYAGLFPFIPASSTKILKELAQKVSGKVKEFGEFLGKKFGKARDGAKVAQSVPHVFPSTPGQIEHIFRKAEGHLPDTAANRLLLKGVADDAATTLGKDQFGNIWSAKLLSDGTQIWTQTRFGTIINGGLNQVPKTFNPLTGLSGS